MNEIKSFLTDLLNISRSTPTESYNLPAEIFADIQKLVRYSEQCKGALTVLITLLTYKYFHNEQDIRIHQSQMPGGFSGRSFDTHNITPFLKESNFPSMAETGWLTRSLEQPYPYSLNYQGKIQKVKTEFLRIIDAVQTKNVKPYTCLYHIFSLLILKRDSEQIDLAHPHNLPITKILEHLESHFNTPVQGSARLPVIALYSAYQCMMKGERYSDKTLLTLESHTSSDIRSGRAGDIDITNTEGIIFESIEVKHNIRISSDIIRTAYEKFKAYPIDRYYILTTANMDNAKWEQINYEIDSIRDGHGCQVIVNGVYSTLRYYLRTLKSTDQFISNYIANLKSDPALKYEHRQAWNKIICNPKKSNH